MSIIKKLKERLGNNKEDSSRRFFASFTTMHLYDYEGITQEDIDYLYTIVDSFDNAKNSGTSPE